MKKICKYCVYWRQPIHKWIGGFCEKKSLGPPKVFPKKHVYTQPDSTCEDWVDEKEQV
jgi:hypothetical protein